MDPLTLPPDVALELQHWIAAARERHGNLSVRDLRRGIQSVSRVYVEARAAGSLGGRATGGLARRAAFACYYAPLHFLTAWHLASELQDVLPRAPGRILDLGCGTAAVSAALARRADAGPAVRVEGFDALGWALGEARHTWRAFGLRGRGRRSSLPKGFPRAGEGDLVVAGWFLNECEAGTRDAIAGSLLESASRGAQLLVLEPLAGRLVPWWDAWAGAADARGLRSGLWKQPVALPDELAQLDEAAGLDHSVLGARFVAGTSG